VVQENLKLSVYEALQTVSASDMEGYYRATLYFGVHCMHDVPSTGSY
jgi:hypothetical protein